MSGGSGPRTTTPQPYLQDADFTLYHGDALAVLPFLPVGVADCVVTSPPYLDARPEYPSPTPSEFNAIFEQLRRIVAGPMLLNVGRIWRKRTEQLWWTGLLEQAWLQDWHLLDTLIWLKPNANPIHGEVFANRHEYVFVLGTPGTALNVDAVRVPYAKSSVSRMRRGWINHTGVKNGKGRKPGLRPSEPHPDGGRAPSYVEVFTGGEKGNEHPAPMPVPLADYLVQVASWPGQAVLDPFIGSGTTAIATRKQGRRCIGVELSEEYCALAARRTHQLSLEAV